jgi:hypothetical protein
MKIFTLAALLLILTGICMKVFGWHATGHVGDSTSGGSMASLSGTQVILIGLMMLFLLAMTWLDKQKKSND